FVVHQIELLAAHGVDEVVLNLHYLSHEIKKLLGDGRAFGLKIYYSIEETPLGTAGAVKNAEEFFGSEPMLVFNGDVLCDINISQMVNFHYDKGAIVTLALTEVDDPTPFGLIITDENARVKKFIEKPGWDIVTARTINAGLYVVDPKIFADVPKDKPYSFERQLYPALLEKGAPIYGFLSNAYWLDIGNPQKYKEAHQAILHGEVAVKIAGTKSSSKFWLGKEVEIASSVSFLGPCVIGDRVKIGGKTELVDSVVIGDRVVVGEHCSLDRAIIWSETKIGDRVKLADCVIGKKCVIEDDVIIDRGIVLADGSVIKKGTRMVD
ncbi:MAG: NDP-sugar synthase, partial [Candidatus Margulisbacteria bacterium]|nr:NDP-sugar synthase [Candidatus Margulisiibacteriota bacterium]